jgi:hypothetical protein
VTKVPDEYYERHFNVLLNILQFLTKKVFVAAEAKKKLTSEKRTNSGSSIRGSEDNNTRVRRMTSFHNGEPCFYKLTNAENVFDTAKNVKDLFKSLKKHGKGLESNIQYF